MADSPILGVLRAWAAVAWADGVLAEPEADSLRRLIRAAELSPDERAAAQELLAAPVTLPEHLAIPDGARRGIYRAACRLAIVDHMFTQKERGVLARLRELLGLSPEIAAEVEAEVPGLL